MSEGLSECKRVSNSNSSKDVKGKMSEIHFYRTIPPYSIAGVGTHQELDHCIYNGSRDDKYHTELLDGYC